MNILMISLLRKSFVYCAAILLGIFALNLITIRPAHAWTPSNEWAKGQDGADCDWKNASLIVCDQDSAFYYDLDATVAAGYIIFSMPPDSGDYDGYNTIDDGSEKKKWYLHLQDGTSGSGYISSSADANRQDKGYIVDSITSDNEGGDNMLLATGNAPTTEPTGDYVAKGATDTKEPGSFKENADVHKYENVFAYEVCGLYSAQKKHCYDLSKGVSGDYAYRDLAADTYKNLKEINQAIFDYKNSRDKCSDDGGSLSFIFCPLLQYTRDAVQKLIGGDGSGRGFIIELLTVSPLSQTGSNKALYDIWKAFRDVALGLFILIFMIIIFGNGLGIEAYTIKRALPRLAFGALFTFASFYILQTLIDITNLLGNAIPALLTQITANSNISGYNIDLSGGLQGVGIILMIVFALLALIAVLVGIAGLIARQLIIFMLVLSAPFAFVMWVLPNTENLFKKWWSNLIRVLFMFPMITGMIAMSLVFQATTSTSSSNVVKLAGTLAPLVALMMIPKSFKWGGEAFAAASGFAAGWATKANAKVKSTATNAGKSIATSPAKRIAASDAAQRFGMTMASTRGVRALGGKTMQRKLAGVKSARISEAAKLTENMSGAQLATLANNGNYQEKIAAIGQLAKMGDRGALIKLAQASGSTGAAYTAASAKFAGDWGKNVDLRRIGGSYSNMSGLSDDQLAQLSPDAFKHNIAEGRITDAQLRSLAGNDRAKNVMSQDARKTLETYINAPAGPVMPGSPGATTLQGSATTTTGQAAVVHEIKSDPKFNPSNLSTPQYRPFTKKNGDTESRGSHMGERGVQ